MSREFEAKLLDIDVAETRQRLAGAGAILDCERELQRRVMVDTSDLKLDRRGAWLRIRESCGSVTIALKQQLGDGPGGIDELETTVGSFDAILRLLERIGFEEKAFVETYRETWTAESCSISIDEWPHLPAYLEIEGSSMRDVYRMVDQLGFCREDAVFGSTDELYERYYGLDRRLARTMTLRFGQSVPPEFGELPRRLD